MIDKESDSSAEQPAIDPAILSAAKTLLPGSPVLTPIADRPFLVLADVDGRTVRLRRWPDGTVPERVRFVNRLQTSLSDAEPVVCAAPFSSGAKGVSSLQVGGAMVDAQHWLPGHPSAERSIIQLPSEHTLHRPAALSEARLDGLITLVAEMHDRGMPFTRQRTSPVASIPQLLRAIGQHWRLARTNLRPTAPQYPPIQRWLRIGEQLLPAAEHAILEANLGDKPPVIAHLSLWPAHVLVDRASVSGLLDFGAVVMTTPLLDVSHIVTRFPGWTTEHAELVLNRYADHRPLSPDERRALPAIAAMDTVIEAARLLRLGYGAELPAASRQAVAAREGAQHLLDSMDAILATVLRSVLPAGKQPGGPASKRTGRAGRHVRKHSPRPAPRKTRAPKSKETSS